MYLSLQVFINAEGALYSFKGLVGRLGPIGVHASMLAILGGVAFGGISGYKGSVMVPQGSDFLVASALRPVSPLASPPSGEATNFSVPMLHLAILALLAF